MSVHYMLNRILNIRFQAWQTNNKNKKTQLHILTKKKIIVVRIWNGACQKNQNQLTFKPEKMYFWSYHAKKNIITIRCKSCIKMR